MTYQLLGQRNLLELQLVHAGGGGPKQRTGRKDESVLHNCDVETTSYRRILLPTRYKTDAENDDGFDEGEGR